MSHKKPSPLVSTLRFPEFREAGEWIFEEFSKYVVLYRGSSPRPIQNYLTKDNSGVNWIKIGDTKYAENFTISQVEEKITLKGAEKSRKVSIGELILANSMSYGKTYQVAIDGYIYDGWFVLRNYEEYFDKQFLLQLLNSEYMQNQYKRFSAGGIVQNISSDIVYSTILPNTSFPEQQKIAACLSSLDELITAHSQKLDALKKHKKGLMQQLFPAEGETVPTLRFPEFRDAGEWVEKRLVDVCKKISQGGTPDTSNSDYWNGSIEWLTPAEMGKIETRFIQSTARKITEEGFKNCSSDLLPINSVIISTRAPIGHLAINKSKMAINQGCKGLIPKESTYYDFLYYSLLISKPFLIDLGAGNTFKELAGNSLKNFEIPLPTLPEQQKIAACLSSLDELITAQSQKLDALKKHKKGLMQRLFPAVEV